MIKTIKSVAIDPGFGFAAACSLIFSSSNPVGFVACLTATGIIIAVKAAKSIQPNLVNAKEQSNSKIAKLIADHRTPLRVLGLALLTMTGATLTQNLTDVWTAATSIQDFISKGWTSIILPATASTAFAICNFGYAAQISTSSKITKPKDKKEDGVLKLIMKRPETYNATGTLAVGLMTGGLGLLCVPFLVAACGVTIRNIVQNRPGHDGHPNLYFAGSQFINLCLAVSNIVSGTNVFPQVLLATAFSINAFALIRIESLTTPGGFKQVLQDIKKACTTTKNDSSCANKPPSLAPQPASHFASAVLKTSFNAQPKKIAKNEPPNKSKCQKNPSTI